MNKFIFIILLISFNAYSKSEYNIVDQPYLESKLSCDNIKNKVNLCFIESKEHYDFKSFIFTFRIELKIKENELEKTIQAAADQISLSLNPLTAEFYKNNSFLITNLKSKKMKLEDAIVELKVTNNNKNYTAYMYPKKNKNGNISLISNFFTGNHDALEKLKFNCKLVKSTPLSDEESIDDACRPYNSNITN
ncbi:hypothetical protein [Vibrio gangliei]|uniref:hypothetical protein n=1 Tax=Vibrio gangliei TaxID=2077090 RepID=UPI000D01B044|nr:hypothetical protein [Vibrio gangliei]